MTDKEKLIKIKSLADKMCDTAFNMTTDASLLRKAMDEYLQFIINEYHKEEPVSEELEDAATKSANKATPYTRVDVGNGEVYVYTKHIVIDRFKAGAKWQKAKLMANATVAIVAVDAGGYPYIDKHIELYDYDNDVPLAKEGDKYKVILIKED